MAKLKTETEELEEQREKQQKKERIDWQQAHKVWYL